MRSESFQLVLVLVCVDCFFLSHLIQTGWNTDGLHLLQSPGEIEKDVWLWLCRGGDKGAGEIELESLGQGL